MKTIQAQMDVPGSGMFTIPVPGDLSPGRHGVFVVIDEAPLQSLSSSLDHFPVDSIGQWPTDLCLSRKDMYGDDER